MHLLQRHKQCYEQQLLRIMNQFNVFNECQLVTGCVLEWDAVHSKRKGKRFEARKHMAEAFESLRSKFQRQGCVSKTKARPDKPALHDSNCRGNIQLVGLSSAWQT